MNPKGSVPFRFAISVQRGEMSSETTRSRCNVNVPSVAPYTVRPGEATPDRLPAPCPLQVCGKHNRGARGELLLLTSFECQV